jgi:hypothetical protein
MVAEPCRTGEMKRAVGYVSLILGWVMLVSAVGIAIAALITLLLHFGDVIPWRVALIGFIAIVVGLLSFLTIRWARSALGTPGGSRVARIALGTVLISFGVINLPPSDPNAPAVGRDGWRAAVAATVLFGAALIFEAAWLHRAS